jgi:hypothetical protein
VIIRSESDEWLLWVVYLVLAVCVGILVWVIIDSLQPHPTISLDARDWVCTRTETRLSPLMVGKVITEQAATYCVRYEVR